MPREPQLSLFEANSDNPNLRSLEYYLDTARAWLTANQLGERMPQQFTDRQLRALAAASDRIISGQRGYRHIRHATAEEVTHAANWLEHQAKEMGERAQRIRRAAHALVG